MVSSCQQMYRETAGTVYDADSGYACGGRNYKKTAAITIGGNGNFSKMRECALRRLTLMVGGGGFPKIREHALRRSDFCASGEHAPCP